MVTIPRHLEELFTTTEYAGGVRSFMSVVGAILDDNKMPFFPGYTDHGRQHAEAVLRTIDRLIPEDVWTARILTGSDATILVCAALLHDVPMYLGEEGFLALISGESGHQPVPWFEWRQDRGCGDKPWPELWDDFATESRRWGDEMLVRIFGPRVMHSEWTIGRLATNRAEWCEYDRLWIGEFIRRHHGRLAHKIAYHGFPGLSDDTPGAAVPALKRDARIPYDLAGLIARSHTMELRQCVEYLKWKYSGDLRPFASVPVYLMALLRVADYLQLDSARARWYCFVCENHRVLFPSMNGTSMVRLRISPGSTKILKLLA